MFSVILNHILILLGNLFHSSNQSILRAVSELKPAWQAGVAKQVRKLPGRERYTDGKSGWTTNSVTGQTVLFSKKFKSTVPGNRTSFTNRDVADGRVRMSAWCGLQSDNDTTYEILTKGGSLSQHGSLYRKAQHLGSWSRRMAVCLRPSLGYSLRLYLPLKKEKQMGWKGLIWTETCTVGRQYMDMKAETARIPENHQKLGEAGYRMPCETSERSNPAGTLMPTFSLKWKICIA